MNAPIESMSPSGVVDNFEFKELHYKNELISINGKEVLFSGVVTGFMDPLGAKMAYNSYTILFLA